MGANYRAACRAKSTKGFIYKMGLVEEEADESFYWMELLLEAWLVKVERLQPLMVEADELIALLSLSITTARGDSK